jgi:hypothetical protein
MTSARIHAVLEALNGALWEVDTEDDPMVVIGMLVALAAAIAAGEWEPERARTIVGELVDAAFVEEEAVH